MPYQPQRTSPFLPMCFGLVVGLCGGAAAGWFVKGNAPATLPGKVESPAPQAVPAKEAVAPRPATDTKQADPPTPAREELYQLPTPPVTAKGQINFGTLAVGLVGRFGDDDGPYKVLASHIVDENRVLVFVKKPLQIPDTNVKVDFTIGGFLIEKVDTRAMSDNEASRTRVDDQYGEFIVCGTRHAAGRTFWVMQPWNANAIGEAASKAAPRK